MKIWEWILNLLKLLSSNTPEVSAPADRAPTPNKIDYYSKDNIIVVQKRLTVHGYRLTADGIFGPVTKGKLAMFKAGHGLGQDSDLDSKTMVALNEEPKKATTPAPKPVDQAPARKTPSWMVTARKYIGKGEHDSVFVKWLSGFWKITGLSFNTIVGSKFAWCGLFVAVVLYLNGFDIAKGAAGARNWAKYAIEINWQVDGIPEGAVIHLNHDGVCSQGSDNHVSLANGDCAAHDLLEMIKGSDGVYKWAGNKPVVKKGASIDLLGGNQGNTVKVSTYSAKKICAVRWPALDKLLSLEYPLPSKILKSRNCTSSKPDSGESTR